MQFSALVHGECLIKEGKQAALQKRLGKQANPFHKQEGESEMLFQLLVFNSLQQTLHLVVLYGICLLERQIKNGKVAMLLSSDDISIKPQYFHYF